MTSAAQRLLAYARFLSVELRALMHWWVTELKDLGACLFRWATERSSPQFVLAVRDGCCTVLSRDGQEPVAQVPMSTFDAATSADALVSAGLPKRARARLLLPATELLLCQLRLPFLKESDLAAALELQLERKLPLPRSLVYVDWRTQRRGPAAPIDVTVALIRRASVDRVVAAIRTSGWRVCDVDVQGHPGWSFLPRMAAAAHLSIQPRDRWLLAALSILGIVFAATVAGQWAYERTSLGEELMLAREQRASVVSQSRVIEREGAPILLLQRVMAVPDSIAALQAMTDVIPADSWVYRTRISATLQAERVLEISGYAPVPQALVEVLERHPALERVELITASGAESTATSRVELRAQLPAISPISGNHRAPR